MLPTDIFETCVDRIKNCEVLIIGTGAGMGVDSGLPAYRGRNGLWTAPPPVYSELGISLMELATLRGFRKDIELGWGFFGEQLDLYRTTVPHKGFYILLDWINRYHLDYFVLTSNIDGQFQKAGFAEPRIREIHGSIHYLQCLHNCSPEIWHNDEMVPIEQESMKATHIPKCKFCQGIARPNILMFSDEGFLQTRRNGQDNAYYEFVKSINSRKLLIIEIGVGTAVPTIRKTNEFLARKYAQTTIIRINPSDYKIDPPHISLPLPGLEALEKINSAFQAKA